MSNSDSFVVSVAFVGKGDERKAEQVTMHAPANAVLMDELRGAESSRVALCLNLLTDNVNDSIHAAFEADQAIQHKNQRKHTAALLGDAMTDTDRKALVTVMEYTADHGVDDLQTAWAEYCARLTKSTKISIQALAKATKGVPATGERFDLKGALKTMWENATPNQRSSKFAAKLYDIMIDAGIKFAD
jgi:hypothetical protein